MILPSRRLCDYKKYIRPQRSFTKDVVNELLESVKDFSDNKKGDCIGYVDFGDAESNYATLHKSTNIATHHLTS